MIAIPRTRRLDMPASETKQYFCGCGEVLSGVQFNDEQNLIRETDNKILGSKRDFIGVCPVHGKVFAQFRIGNHSSMRAKHLKQEFWKHKDYLHSKLTQQEYRFFYEAVHGRAATGVGHKRNHIKQEFQVCVSKIRKRRQQRALLMVRFSCWAIKIGTVGCDKSYGAV